LNQSGNANTAVGSNALSNSTGNNNTACGAFTLLLNLSGNDNTAVGSGALGNDQNSSDNTAVGFGALNADTTGSNNTSIGYDALSSNNSGYFNAAGGASALFANTSGGGNTAFGYFALAANTTASDNTAFGDYALYQSTGANDTGIGVLAGSNLTSGNNNIYICNEGASSESNTIRIGDGYGGNQIATYIAGIENATVTGSPVYINSSGQLGLQATSSRRFKDGIKNMGAASDAVLSLKPVTYVYIPHIDPKGVPQFGLIAEDVEKACPDLVIHDTDGSPYAVRYDAVGVMLLNEFLKEHGRVMKLEASNLKLQATVAEEAKAFGRQQKDFQGMLAQQQQEIKDLTASLKEQGALLEKVSARVEVKSPAPRMAANN
jgi:hypothetical protein